MTKFELEIKLQHSRGRWERVRRLAEELENTRPNSGLWNMRSKQLSAAVARTEELDRLDFGS